MPDMTMHNPFVLIPISVNYFERVRFVEPKYRIYIHDDRELFYAGFNPPRPLAHCAVADAAGARVCKRHNAN